MTKEEYRKSMTSFFDILEYFHGYYWHWEKMLKIFDLVNELSFANDLVSFDVYDRTHKYIEKEKERFE